VRALPNSELKLKNGRSVGDYEIALSIIEGEFPADEYEEKTFSPDAFGGLWYVEDQNFVHGWFYIKQNIYAAIWDQVRTGGYTDCTITLGIRPETFHAWTENPLSIVSVDVRFARIPFSEIAEQKKPSRKSWFGRT
jgi:hypothetical protein